MSADSSYQNCQSPGLFYHGKSHCQRFPHSQKTGSPQTRLQAETPMFSIIFTKTVPQKLWHMNCFC